jgi:proline dehydrogenase
VRTAAVSPVRRLLGGLLPPRFAGTATDEALRAARRTVASGRLVSLEHRAATPSVDVAELTRLIGLVDDASLSSSCDLLVDVDRLGVPHARTVVAAATAAGLGVVLAGRPAQVGPLAGEPSAAFLVPAGEPGAEERCRALADRRVRLVSGRGMPAGLAFVRCLNVLMAGHGRPAVATTDERLIAIAGERAAWYGRASDSFEHVLPCGVREDEQQRLVAAGYRVRVALPSGAGNAPTAAYGRLLGGVTWAR